MFSKIVLSFEHEYCQRNVTFNINRPKNKDVYMLSFDSSGDKIEGNDCNKQYRDCLRDYFDFIELYDGARIDIGFTFS